MRKKDTVVQKRDNSGRHKAETVVYAAQNKKAGDPVILQMKEFSQIADYFVILSGNTSVQVRAIVSEIERVCRDEQIAIAHIEGKSNGIWVLIDLGDVMVHVFTESQRRYYNLEAMWDHCPRLTVPTL